MIAIRRSFAFAIVGLAACAAAPSDEGTAAQAIAETLEDTNAPLLVKDPRTLAALSRRGRSFAEVLGVRAADPEREASGEDLLASERYARIVDTIDFDLRQLRTRDPLSGVGVDFRHRQFDPAWLRSREARFELVAVVDRLDRRHVDRGSCGEVRLIYRLAYTATRSARACR